MGPTLETNKRTTPRVTRPESNAPPTTTPPPTTATSKRKQSRYWKPVKVKATSTQANRQILVAVGAGVSVVLIARISGAPGVERLNDPGDLIKIAVGTGATVIALMIMAEVAPDVAIGLAWLICIGALLAYGIPFATAIAKGTLNPGIPLTPFGPDAEKGIGTVPKGTF